MQNLRDNWPFLLIFAGMIVAWLLLYTPGTRLESMAAFDQHIQRGQPTVVEFYSNT